MTTLESTITAVAARCLRSTRDSAGTIDAEAPFELLGLDSLATIELAAALEEELGCELPEDLLAGCADVESLANRLTTLGIANARHRADDPFEQMFADAVLPGDIRPAPGTIRADEGLRGARTILLTGATGFLGAAILDQLLETSDADVVCLVRRPGLQRRPDRVRTVIGDIAQPHLGLPDDTYEALVRDVDAVCHAAAAVNWVYSYAGLRAANVVGTGELLRLACRAGAPFHFISSLSACYSTTAPRCVDETFDALPGLRGLHLGYAQTKAVGEALVREAGHRGLPVRIYRPALISGHSLTGAFNRDDIVATLVRGCVHMRTAPDLDWRLDAVPVDVVAKWIVHLSGACREPSAPAVFHLAHPRPRHWRECLLWMRIYGYDVRLVSYHAWLRQLEQETLPSGDGSASHPLRPLRSFFLDRPSGARGLTMPELYEERRRTQARSGRTHGALSEAPCPALDAALLDTYFTAFRKNGDLPQPTHREQAEHPEHPEHPEHAEHPEHREHPEHPSAPASAKAELSRAMGRPVQRMELLSSGSDHSIISELTAWRSMRPTGLFRARVTTEAGTQDVFVKRKAEDTHVMAVGEALADLVDPAVGTAYRRHVHRVGFTASHAREIAICRQTDARFTRHMPRVLGTIADHHNSTWLAVLENISESVLMNSADDPHAWGEREITAAVDGLAALHAVWLGKEPQLRRETWIGHVATTESMDVMTDLWTALADHAAPLFSGWSDPAIAVIHHRLASTAGKWWPALEDGARTLIHNDFNPRNVCLRTLDDESLRLCAYDWELATIGAPQRDLAEFLCFVLADGRAGHALRWIEHHRQALERESGAAVDSEAWTRGFRSALYDFLINRLAMYAMVHRVRPQSFLPRIVRTWLELYRQFPLDGEA